MKNRLTIVFITIALIACEKRKIYNQYQDIRYIWYLKTINGQPPTDSLLQFLDFTTGKIAKKNLKSTNHFFSVPINHYQSNGLYLSYQLTPHTDTLFVSNIFNRIPLADGVTVVTPTIEEERLTTLLQGSWQYHRLENEMIWLNTKYRLLFTLEE